MTFFFASLFANAQKDPIKWKEISKEEINLKEYPPDILATAVILCDYERMYFDLNPNGNNLFLFRDRHIRIKILKKSGLKYAKIKIPYNDMHCNRLLGETSYTLKAITYNFDKNGKIKKSKLKNKNITIKDSTNCIRILINHFFKIEVANVFK